MAYILCACSVLFCVYHIDFVQVVIAFSVFIDTNGMAKLANPLHSICCQIVWAHLIMRWLEIANGNENASKCISFLVFFCILLVCVSFDGPCSFSSFLKRSRWRDALERIGPNKSMNDTQRIMKAASAQLWQQSSLEPMSLRSKWEITQRMR